MAKGQELELYRRSDGLVRLYWRHKKNINEYERWTLNKDGTVTRQTTAEDGFTEVEVPVDLATELTELLEKLEKRDIELLP